MKRFGEAFEIIIRPERYVRLDEDLARALQSLVRNNGEQDPLALEEGGGGEGIGVRQIAVDMLRFGMRYQWTAEANMRAWEELTPREQEVAALVCLGYTNGQIAQRLTISPSTVKTHIRNVLHKFGLNGKLELKGVLRDWNFSEWEQGES
ncbi:MAG: helix-turn-helix transcriptional regulator [Syntrophales bacterium]|nr:helix-turn-helix transcriptional regulator [Syntrophales bacterium]